MTQPQSILQKLIAKFTRKTSTTGISPDVLADMIASKKIGAHDTDWHAGQQSILKDLVEEISASLPEGDRQAFREKTQF